MTVVEMKDIKTNGNIRHDLGDVEGLAQSIDRHGLLQPLNVAEHGDGDYTLIAGHRRYAALQSLGVEHVEVHINNAIDRDEDRVAAQYAENVHRTDLTAYERAQVALELKDLGLKQEAVADELGITKAEVSKQQKIARVIGELPNSATADALSGQALFDLVDIEVDDATEYPLVLENALRALVEGNASSVCQAIGGAEREARDVRILELLEPVMKQLYESSVEFVKEKPARAETLALHNLDSNYGNQMGFNEEEVIEHRQYDCHKAHMGKGYSGPVLMEYCIKPASHREKGKSDLKEASADEKQTQREQATAERKAQKDAKQARKDQVAKVLGGKWSQKDAIALITDTVRLGSDANRVTTGALDLPKIKSQYGDYRDYSAEIQTWIETLPANKQALAPIMVLAAYQYVEYIGVKDTPILDMFEGSDG